jgi:amidase
MKGEFANLDATAQAELIREKEATPQELVDAAIESVEKLNPQLNAVITPLFDKARAQAKSGAIPDGPFRGVPFMLKDLMCASGGDPIYFGMRLLRDARIVAPYDTYLAAKFKAAGFICIGKTNTPELGLNATTEPEAFGASRNPWNTNHSTGGSSGGSAAAVASRMVAMAHANDGGGSIRIPASECGLVGLKPSRGRVSWGPDTGDAWHGLAIEGVVTRSVRDTAGVLDAIAGNMPGDPYSAPPQRRPFIAEAGANPEQLRVGVMKRTQADGAPLHPDCLAAVDNAARLMQSLGHHVEESHPAALDEPEYVNWFNNVVCGHAAATIDQIGNLLGRKINAEDVEPWTWRLYERGSQISASEYLGAIQGLQVWTRRVAQWWAENFDLLLTPTIAQPPPPLGTLVMTPEEPDRGWQRLTDLIQFTPAYNATGKPAISLPLHWNREGLPIGVQLVAAFGHEDLLIQAAAQLEEAQPWKDRRPPVCA